MSREFSAQLDELLRTARAYAAETCTDLIEQVHITTVIEQAANDVRENNMRALQHLLAVFGDQGAARKARELADEIARQGQWPTN